MQKTNRNYLIFIVGLSVIIFSFVFCKEYENHENIKLIPSPQKIEIRGGKVIFKQLNISSNFSYPTSFVSTFKRFLGTELIIAENGQHKPQELGLDLKIVNNPVMQEEEYYLEVFNDKVSILANCQKGIFYGIQTLTQLIRPDKGEFSVPLVKVHDFPSLSIRGFMHDVGRNFQELDDLLHQIDIFAFYKINVFHWHLTDHPAWRIECIVHPELNDSSYQRSGRDNGRFYSYDEIRRLIMYAKDRGIMVIPEIDMPGHSSYFKRAFGVSMNSAKGMLILEDCLQEFFEQIPVEDCPYLHIGSDEIHIDNPKEFMSRMETFVIKNQRIPVVWDPGLKPGNVNTVRQIWPDGNLLQNPDSDSFIKYPSFDSSSGYINDLEPMSSVMRQYLRPPFAGIKLNEKTLGGILCCWPDVKVVDKRNIFRHNPVWPGVLAFSERFWRNPEIADPVTFELYPKPGIDAFKKMNLFEDKMIDHRERFFNKEAFPWFANSFIEWEVSDPIQRRINLLPNYDYYSKMGDSLQWHSVYGGTINFDHVFDLENSTFSDTMYIFARTNIYSPKDQTIYSWVGFETPTRSNRRSSGIPEIGSWDANGGNVWLNRIQLPPPKWNEPGKYKYIESTWHGPGEELPYTDEQLFFAREPAKMKLKKGWNELVFMAVKTNPKQYFTISFCPLEYKDGILSEARSITIKINK